MVQLVDIQKQAKVLSEEDRESLVAFLLPGSAVLRQGLMMKKWEGERGIWTQEQSSRLATLNFLLRLDVQEDEDGSIARVGVPAEV